MQGLELSRLFYNDIVNPLLQKNLGEAWHRLALGLVGEGSECFGFDDAFSQDHDFGAGLCIWVPQEEKQTLAPRITQALAEIPKEFMGFTVRMGMDDTAQTAQRMGIFSIEEFYARFTNSPTPPATWQQWYLIPEHFLAVCTNGDVFYDGLGQFTAFREQLLAFYPEDVRKKKLAARLGAMAQSGQYNLLRLIERGNGAAAYLACSRFVENALASYFLIHKKYMPFYKWAFNSLDRLPQGKEFSVLLQKLMSLNFIELTTPHAKEQAYVTVQTLIENVCTCIVQLLLAQQLSTNHEPWLMVQAQELQASITHPQIQGLPLLHGTQG